MENGTVKQKPRESVCLSNILVIVVVVGGIYSSSSIFLQSEMLVNGTVRNRLNMFT